MQQKLKVVKQLGIQNLKKLLSILKKNIRTFHQKRIAEPNDLKLRKVLGKKNP